MMEFFGKPQYYLNRVKTADESLVLRQLLSFTQRLSVSG
jgi:hypothetical protein